MFVKNTAGADLLPGLITAIAIAALGLAFVGKFSTGVKDTGDNINNAANTFGGSVDTSVNTIK
jgi:hypothetical protein